MMDLEGLKAWLPGRTTGFGPLTAAVAAERFFETRRDRDDAAAVSGDDGRQLAAGRRRSRQAQAAATADSGSIAPGLRSRRRCRRDRPCCGCSTSSDATSSPTASCGATTSIRSWREKLDRRAPDDARRDARRRRGQGRFRAAAPDARRPGLLDQQSGLRRERSQRREPLAGEDLRFLRRHTDRPIKITLPGPYLLTRAMFVPEVTARVLSGQGGAGRGRRGADAARARRAGRRRRRLRAARRAGADARWRSRRADADVHVRGAGGAPGSRGGARVRRVARSIGLSTAFEACASASTCVAATGAGTKRRC